MKVLVTGGLGYIGSHTVIELLQLGHQVVVVDNLSNSKKWIKDRIESISKKSFDFFQNDVNDYEAMDAIFKSHTIDGVIHFAAHKAVGESVLFPEKYYENNISGLVNLLRVVNNHQVQKFIFSSSCTVYGNTSNNPVNENAPIVAAESPYGTTKIIGERILQDISKFRDLKIILLRYFNPVGAHSTGLIGELPLGVPNNLVPYITQTAAGIREKLTVYGNDYDTPDGTAVRDYIHVQDLALAHVKALDYTAQMTENHDFFNIGTGKGNTVLEVIQAFENVNNKPVSYEIGPRRAGDVEKIWADNQKALQVLGWQPKYAIKDMMLHAWKWQCEIQKSKN